MRSSIRSSNQCGGFTLLEILITIVVLSIAATAIMGVYISTVAKSADPLIQQQAIAIAEAYMEEIQLKQFCEDPPLCALETSREEGAETRAVFNDAQDYNDPLVDGAIRDQNDAVIAALSDYSIDVVVSAADLGVITQASNNALRIDLTVSHPAVDDVIISGFRTNY